MAVWIGGKFAAAIAALRNSPCPRPRDQPPEFAVAHRAVLYRVWGADSVHRASIPRRHRGKSSFGILARLRVI
uniref:Uncharacterized protein n=1 Tax=Zea mays TaxID=4577 RepID=B6TA60_MAIZE|nr:hypothetical protein [Zea mays]